MTPSDSRHRPLPSGITREVLERDELRQALATAHPGVEMVSDAQMQRSIHTMLAQRPANADLDAGAWVFGYGSLLWNPCVPVAEWLDVLLYGFHRDFRIRLTHGRGSAEAPGLMLGLVPGGSCRGMALRLPPDDVEHELLMIWRREMLTGVYTPRWVTLYDRAGASLPAMTFVANAEHDSFCRRLEDATVIEMLATGHGMIGSAAEYLNSTVAHLDEQGIHDRRLRTLRARVNAAVAERRAAD
ncbi:gamma-glutamylcyclotransferase [Salinisphaera hydrothermalis]|uniref:gamma-glutamylcyclotransferase n=1 Tax=Salinisphaera hydrothermalis TaxID=563188 RepID=UPI000A019A81|nr:gamma-glutamylcyclotransferase [Salinisphaera hydrothermalis]